MTALRDEGGGTRLGRAADDGDAPLRLAHRGDHRHAPENTLAAFRAALAVPGCDGLEFDVRLSGDGIPVVLHDETLRRVHGRSERVADLSAAALVTIGVPTLATVLAEVGTEAFLDVELKIAGAAGPVVDALRDSRGPAPARVVISSFEHEALARVAELAGGWPRWLNAGDLSGATIGAARELGCAGVSVRWQAIDEPGVRRAQLAGLDVAAWTVRRPEVLRRIAGLGLVAVCIEGSAMVAPPDDRPPDRQPPA